jgi:hypothetical protein
LALIQLPEPKTQASTGRDHQDKILVVPSDHLHKSEKQYFGDKSQLNKYFVKHDQYLMVLKHQTVVIFLKTSFDKQQPVKSLLVCGVIFFLQMFPTYVSVIFRLKIIINY